MDGKRESSKLVIFDLDGTLVELPIDYNALKQELKEKLHTKFDTIFSTIRGFQIKQQKESFDIMDKYELAALDKLKIRDGAKKAVQDAKKFGLTTAIVTLQGFTSTKKILSKIGISNLVDSVVTREDSLYREKQISIILERLECLSSNTIVIGDKVDDYDAGSKLGCSTFLVRKMDKIPYCDLNEFGKLVSV